jgi:hypothetical protein
MRWLGCFLDIRLCLEQFVEALYKAFHVHITGALQAALGGLTLHNTFAL